MECSLQPWASSRCQINISVVTGKLHSCQASCSRTTFLPKGSKTHQSGLRSNPSSKPSKPACGNGMLLLSSFHSPNESDTEQEIIVPILKLLGWHDYLSQQGTQGREEVPDYLLFADSEAKQQAAASPQPTANYDQALVVAESKRWGLSLDQRNQNTRKTPSGQLLSYLTTADIASDGRMRWGLLTNGRVWRLYDHRSRPRHSRYFEVDLNVLQEEKEPDALRLFYLLLRKDSFLPQQGATASFLEWALDEGDVVMKNTWPTTCPGWCLTRCFLSWCQRWTIRQARIYRKCAKLP